MKKPMNKIFPIFLFMAGTILPAPAMLPKKETVNPLSKIIITSNRATCQKDIIIPQQYVFNYQENVVVTFADKSTITANNLEIVFDGKALGKKEAPDTTKTNFLDKFKKIIFCGNVVYTSQSRTVTAKKAELQLAEHICTLTGNVAIQQKKNAPKEIPITIESDEAKLNLQTQELLLSGSLEKPVNTVISLEDYEPLKKKKNTKTQKAA